MNVGCANRILGLLNVFIRSFLPSNTIRFNEVEYEKIQLFIHFIGFLHAFKRL